MPMNDPAVQIWIANLKHAGGGETLYLSDEEASRYNADPDGFAADHFGLSKVDYIEWLACHGAPLCKHRTKTGDLCRNQIDGMKDSLEWRALHRHGSCSSHAASRSKTKASEPGCREELRR
jgi:hypothetical protein